MDENVKCRSTDNLNVCPTKIQSKNVQAKLRGLVDMLLGYLKDIKNPPVLQNSLNFDGTIIKNELGKLGLILANDATKMTLTCKPPCTPSAAIPTINAISETLFLISGHAASVPLSAGKTFANEIKSTTGDIIYASAALANSFLDSPIDMNTTNYGHLISTGILWNACDLFQQLPSNNSIAVSQKWKGILALLEDAICEIVDLISENNQNANDDIDDGWDEILGTSTAESSTLSTTEKEMGNLCLDLIKLVQLLFKKILHRCIDPLNTSDQLNTKNIDSFRQDSINETLDQLVHLGNSIIDCTDELGTNLYSPHNVEIIVSHANDLKSHSQELIGLAMLLTTGSHKEWFVLCDGQLSSFERRLKTQPFQMREYYKVTNVVAKKAHHEGRPFGTCPECNQPRTGYKWCKACYSVHFNNEFSTWTSENEEIDKFIQECQLNSFGRSHCLEWVNPNKFKNIQFLARGGFGTIHKAEWIDGPIAEWDPKMKKWKKELEKKTKYIVALKSLDNSQNITADFLNEVKTSLRCALSNLIIRCLGITRHLETGDYMMIMDYGYGGNMHGWWNALNYSGSLPDIVEQFLLADDIKQKMEVNFQNDFEKNMTYHPQAIYTSRLLRLEKLGKENEVKPINNELRSREIPTLRSFSSDSLDSRQFNLELPSDMC
ncbi:17931_t:CDS:2 [Cetraspora pellucida]|uniref:17931_t:CDS:1 n=1 Tax=Cetraspora pellucida TaxID=1433469 RepID=A0A9N9ANU5_9GLOM|nr:17931_t:CDS:2 [Cetraspora pellucida]